MPVIRITETDKERIDQMRDGRPVSLFITRMLDQIEQPRSNPKLKDKKVHPSFAPMKAIYMQAWRENNSFEYQWNGAIDASALNRLIKNLDNIKDSDLQVYEFFDIIITNLPDFYKDKTINAINKNINGIIAEIKQSKQSTKSPNIGRFDFRS